MKPITLTLPGEIADYLFDQCDAEIEFLQAILDDPRRADKHTHARELLADWKETKRALLAAGVGGDAQLTADEQARADEYNEAEAEHYREYFENGPGSRP